jgi:hypothetical protein
MCFARWHRFLLSRSFHISLATTPQLDLPVPFPGSSPTSNVACLPISRSFHISLATTPQLDLPVPFPGSSPTSNVACFPEFTSSSSVLPSSLYDLLPRNQHLNSVSVLLLQNCVSAGIKIPGGCAVRGGAGVDLGYCVLGQHLQVTFCTSVWTLLSV